MATNKNATIRYQILNRCFRNPGRKYYIEDLIDACTDALLDVDPYSTGVKRRQIFDDIKFMKDSKGFDAPIEALPEGRKRYYRYSDCNFSINNQPLNEQEAQQLKESLMTLSRFKGLPQFDWVEEIKVRLEQSFSLKTEDNILSFDENQYLTGREYIEDLYNAIINKQVIKVVYKPFSVEEEIVFELHPYYLKQYNNRWFLFGKNELFDCITNVALDRIHKIENSRLAYRENTDIDFDAFFDDVIGVSITPETSIQKILLKVNRKQWKYIETKPLHGSQKVKEVTDESAIIQIDVIPNYELEALLLSFGESVEVLSPQDFRNKIRERVLSLNNIYS